ncbi:hypothetical protein PPL_04932 [Heterostelium album PN500]|uniref:Uncharacterized protein n=1 Tax=Heterostelium pallidum (strain ATCC 26659 / Pp 5 / PN500) TaxID=670386 RepID=D3B8Y8_HETP5|nr:hypothetical protein PPL_04932 [Heterostelium album PN500]EFA82027.1 hypothetical protein PPL_04932 [Heterostelium album PN500]|eukprot:XP_020434144.1 hypothetical protein PPL_04932 [Heterostelium album PN500]
MDMGFPFNRSIRTQADSTEEKMDAYLTATNVFKGDITIKWETPKILAA